MTTLSKYGLLGSIRLARDLAFTKIFHPASRLIRLPVYIRGRKFINFGKALTSGPGLRLDAFPNFPGIVLSIGESVQFNDYVHVAAAVHISIGDNTLIASRVFISDHNHGRFDGEALEDGPDNPPVQRPLHAKPVHIGKNVWIGESVCVLPGVTIGDGAVIGAGSVVTRDIPARCVAAGNPARVIRLWDDNTHQWKRV